MPNFGTFTRNRDNTPVRLTLPNTGQDGQQGVNAQYNIFENRFYGGGVYFQYKTNIPFSGWSMHNIEAVGYNYGNSLPIRCNWVFHISYSNGFYQVEYSNIYSGLAAQRAYASSDGYVVIAASTNTAYFAGWSLNAYALNPTGPFEVSILASVQLNSDYNYY
jgi:hypothetical protein